MAVYFSKHGLSAFTGFNLGGINATGQVSPRSPSLCTLLTHAQIPSMVGNWGLIDLDTPQTAYKKKGYADGTTMQLVFSDEFNTEGRSFYPGDDPYWEAVDLHYWQACILLTFLSSFRALTSL